MLVGGFVPQKKARPVFSAKPNTNRIRGAFAEKVRGLLRRYSYERVNLQDYSYGSDRLAINVVIGRIHGLYVVPDLLD